MKTARNRLLAGFVVAVVACGASVCHGQAIEDPKVVGSYVGAIMPHSFNVGGDNFDVRGVLFTFAMGYDPLGFHVGSGRSGVMFAEGRRFSVSTSASVAPFPDPKNRDIDIRVSTDIPSFGELVSTASVQDSAQATWACQTLLNYGRTDGFYFRNDQVTYQTFSADMNLVVQDPSGDFIAQGDIEAVRISPLVYGSSQSRVKIRR